MYFPVKKIVCQFILPAVLIAISAVVVWKWPEMTHRMNRIKELKALFVILPLMPYAIFSAGFFMGWRYRKTGLMFMSALMALAYFSFYPFDPSFSHIRARHSVNNAISFLMPINFVFFTLIDKRRIFTAKGLLCVGLILCQVMFVMIFCLPHDMLSGSLFFKIDKMIPDTIKTVTELSARVRMFLASDFGFQYKHIFNHMPAASFSAFIMSLAFLFIRFLKGKDIMQAGYFGTLAALFLGFISPKPWPAVMVYLSAAGVILIITSIDESFSLAYFDELTGLPGRRSLNDTLLNLGRKYSIAMIDVDHFKKFNDTYGHKTGDDVLKMVASTLSRITGGARTFRYGGEEFTAVFSGKTIEEAKPHLEQYRQAVEETSFIVRDKTRRGQSAKNRGSIIPGRKKVSVTVSIGVAESGGKLSTPLKVLKASDKALYRAKRAGRNRIRL